jgi:dTDP-4-dehydrorhamnose 3,5-epimerase-like enzyme
MGAGSIEPMTPADLWRGLRPQARARLTPRDYSQRDVLERLATTGVEAKELVGSPPGLAKGWIPGVEVFGRTVWPQRQRGWFAEFARQQDPGGALSRVGFWPKQWASAVMFAGTAKGFHIHPPYVPPSAQPAAWFRRLFLEAPPRHALRPYDREQWDAMFFVRGIAEMFLSDERAGLPRRRMRFVIDGDDRPGPNNVGVIIPPGVAHAILNAGPGDLIMVYGTSTQFDPEHEGRIASEVEHLQTPQAWSAYWSETTAEPKPRARAPRTPRRQRRRRH